MVTHKHTHTVVLYTVTITWHTVGSSLLHWPSSFTVMLGPKLSAAKYTQAMNAIFTSSPSLVPVCEKVRRAKRGKLCFSAFLILWAKFSKALRIFANQCLKGQKDHIIALKSTAAIQLWYQMVIPWYYDIYHGAEWLQYIHTCKKQTNTVLHRYHVEMDHLLYVCLLNSLAN